MERVWIGLLSLGNCIESATKINFINPCDTTLLAPILLLHHHHHRHDHHPHPSILRRYLAWFVCGTDGVHVRGEAASFTVRE